MATKSKNKHDVYNWIKDEIIPPCKTIPQIVSCHNLIRNFQQTYDDCELTNQLMLTCIGYKNV